MKILLAIDDSGFSKAAIATVIREFRPADVQVHVLHVVESLRLAPYVGLGVAGLPLDLPVIVEKWLDRAELMVTDNAKLLESAGFHVTSSVTEGDAKKGILEFADKWQPDLIVVGSHGRSGLDRFMLGSVSDNVARHAHCSVRIVRPSAPPPGGNLPATQA